MAANPFAMYGAAYEAVWDGTVDLSNDSFRMVLVGTGYTPNQSADDAWSDISANEISGTGYTTNGKPVTLTVSRSGLAVTVDCDDQSWTGSTLSNVAYAVIVRDADANGALAGTDIPMWFCELEDGGSLSTTNGPLTVTINASGLYVATAGTAA
ncbi:hypothetical protein [Mameliella sp.]|uniref:hypothetical protein n=1 Tax=Mameliella sp. TaxID=1924940 RepID=UPI003B50D92D